MNLLALSVAAMFTLLYLAASSAALGARNRVRPHVYARQTEPSRTLHPKSP